MGNFIFLVIVNLVWFVSLKEGAFRMLFISALAVCSNMWSRRYALVIEGFKQFYILNFHAGFLVLHEEVL